MGSILWIIFSWIMKGIVILMMLSIIAYFCKFVWTMVTNGGRKWYYYDASKPWKGGYWTPLLPSIPPYNEYEWNPDTCRFEHKETGEPLYSWLKPVKRYEDQKPHAKKKRPEWLRFLFEETPATLLEKRRRKKEIEKEKMRPQDKQYNEEFSLMADEIGVEDTKVMGVFRAIRRGATKEEALKK